MRSLFFLFLFTLSLHSQIVVPLQKGWSLVGLPESISDMSIFDSKNVELIWSYDAQNQKWLGYSPQSDLMAKMEQKGIEKIGSVNSYNALWIKSKDEWILSFEPTQRALQTPKTITLQKGWNLVSLPANMRLSPKFFDEDIIWRYSQEGEWESFGVRDVATKPLGTISNKSGIWIYSEEKKSLELDRDASRLTPFEDETSMRSYIKEMVLNNQRPYYGSIDIMPIGLPVFNTGDTSMPQPAPEPTPPMDSASEESQSISETTTTNLQEEGVDEADILKHNGEYIFYLSKSSNKLLITSFDSAATLSPALLSEIELHQNYAAQELYIYKNRLVVLYGGANYYKSFDMPSETPRALIEIYAIDDIQNITKLKSFFVDGSMINSRVIDKNLYFISRFYPSITVEYPKEYIDCSKSEIDYSNYLCGYAHYEGGYYVYDYSKPTLIAEHLTPMLSIDTQTQELLDPKRFYAPNRLDQRASIISITQIDLDSLLVADSISFLGETTHEYLSQDSLYLVSQAYPQFYDFTNYKHQSAIYKFTLAPLAFEAQGFVDGYTLNQFSLSEFENRLRVATTSGFSWSRDGTSNDLYILQSHEGKLDTIGSLIGLGKENETIKAVRFMGDRGYVVTFLESDPFYTIDLSDPEKPKKAGELEISGFSEYLHPISQTQILSIGRDADATGARLGIMIQLFDVSDFTNPALLDKLVIGDSSYHTELSYNHKAFTFRQSDRLFGFAYTNYGYWSGIRNIFGYYTLDADTIVSLGDLSIDIDTNYADAQSRAIFFNQDEKRFILLFSGTKFIAKEVE